MLWQEDQELLLPARRPWARSSGLDAPVAETQSPAHHASCQKVEAAPGATPQALGSQRLSSQGLCESVIKHICH